MAESFIERAKYVLKVSKKPTQEEIMENLKIVLIGMFVMGALGFFIYLLFKFVMLK